MMSCNPSEDDDGKCEAMKKLQKLIVFVGQVVAKFAAACSNDDSEMCEMLVQFEEMIGPLTKFELQDEEEHIDILSKFERLFGKNLTQAIAGIMEACSETGCGQLHQLTDLKEKVKACVGKGDETCRMVSALQRLLHASGEFVHGEGGKARLQALGDMMNSDMMNSDEMQMALAAVANFFAGFAPSCEKNPKEPHCPLIQTLMQVFENGSEPEVPDEHNCLTKEVWAKEKQVWCCTNKNIGCPNPKTYCSSEKKLPEEKRAGCCQSLRLQCTRKEEKALTKQNKDAGKAKAALLKAKQKCKKDKKKEEKKQKKEEKKANKEKRKENKKGSKR